VIKKLRHLDLFSGIGGFSYGLKAYLDTKLYCESNLFCKRVLLKQMDKGILKKARLWGDIRTLSGKTVGTIDIITAGFPCQDISCAGLKKGLDGKRSKLFWEIVRLVEEINPPWVFLENVAAIRFRGLKEIIEVFTDMGYDCRWTCISAKEVGAPHFRKRWFMLANTNGKRLQRDGNNLKTSGPAKAEKGKKTRPQFDASSFLPNWEGNYAEYLRMGDGIPYRVDRIRALGNSVVPKQCLKAFELLAGY